MKSLFITHKSYALKHYAVQDAADRSRPSLPIVGAARAQPIIAVMHDQHPGLEYAAIGHKHFTIEHR
jgi:hypothetical protein